MMHILDEFFNWVGYRWRNNNKKYKNELIIIGLGLGGEAGEVQEVIKKFIRDDKETLTQKRKYDLILELGDVLHYWTRICQYFNISPEQVILENMAKLKERDEKRAECGADFTP